MDGTFDGGVDLALDAPPEELCGDPLAADPTLMGVPGVVPIDLDQDGSAESIGMDLDADGTLDAFGQDTDLDGIAETVGVDIDHDGAIDMVGQDTDGDGQLDSFEAADLGADEGPLIPDDLVEPVIYEPGADPAGDVVWPQFDPSSATDVIGDPAAELDSWHVQEGANSCAVVTQEFILESITGQEFSEAELVTEAVDRGWFTEDGGTSPDDTGKLLELHGIGVERSTGGDLDDLSAALADGQKVIVGIDADEIWYPNEDPDSDITDHGYPGGDGNHAVQVIGIDNSDPDNPMVILNDSGIPGGAGEMVPADVFLSAWDDTENYLIATTGEPPTEPLNSYYVPRAA